MRGFGTILVRGYLALLLLFLYLPIAVMVAMAFNRSDTSPDLGEPVWSVEAR